MRLPLSMLERLKIEANKRDVPYQSLIQIWLEEKLSAYMDTIEPRVCKHEVETGMRDGTTQAERDRIKELERHNKERRPANDILRTASAFFAPAELDRQLKS